MTERNREFNRDRTGPHLRGEPIGPSPRTAVAQAAAVVREGWARSKGSLFCRIASLVRTQVIRRAVRHYAETCFSPRGAMVEWGSLQAGLRVR